MIIQTRKPLVEKPRFSIRYEIISDYLYSILYTQKTRIETTNETVRLIIIFLTRYYIVIMLILAKPYVMRKPYIVLYILLL